MHRVLFANGVRLARAGDLANATPQIATAYLLDSRCNIFAPVLPDDIDAESKNFILDGELLLNLIHHDTTSFGCDILHIILALHLGSVRGVDINGSVAGGQEFIAIAMVRIDKLITYLENHPDVEDPNCIIMGGCLTRKVLLYEKGTLRMGLGDFKNAMKDLSKALEIDEFYTKAREARACTWFGQNMKDDSTIHSEFIRILSENHVDNRGNEVAFAFLATSTLGNSPWEPIEMPNHGMIRCWMQRRGEMNSTASADKMSFHQLSSLQRGSFESMAIWILRIQSQVSKE